MPKLRQYKTVNAHVSQRVLIRGDGLISRFRLRTWAPPNNSWRFDSGILCADCDGRLGSWRLRYGAVRSRTATHYRQDETFELPHADRELLGVCAFGGRASISKRPAFAGVRLGPYEKKFRDVIFSSRSIDEVPEAEIILQRYTVRGDIDPAGHFFYPTRFKITGLNFYNFAVGGFRIRTKVGNRPLPEEMRPLSLSRGRVWGTFTVWEDTSEFQHTVDLMRRHT